jgi:HK97 gp10 family phage protein
MDKLIDTLERIPKELDKTVDAITEANAGEIELQAKRTVPFDTGTLQKSINTRKEKDKTYSISADANYAVYVEYGKPVGTGPHGGPKPFLFPAFFRQRPLFIKDLEDLLKKTFK